MTQDILTPQDINVQDIDFAAIDARARQLRAEAARDGFVAMRNAVTSLFSVSLFGRKTA